MEKNENEERSQNLNFAEKVIAKVRAMLDKYMDGFKDYDELKNFMDDDNKLYDSEGKPTDEYKRKIAEVEEYVRHESIDGTLGDFIVKNENQEEDSEVLKGIIDFIERRKKIIKEYTVEEEDKGEDFRAENFLNKLLNNYSENSEERDKIIEMMETMAEKDTLESLDDENVRDCFKQMINFKK